MSLIEPQIQKYLRRAYGYGNFTAKYWLIGIDQHCRGRGKQLSQSIEKRLSSWGRKCFQDLKDYHLKIGECRYFDCKNPRLSRTWSKLIHFLLGITGEPFPRRRKAVLTYQREQLGRRESDTALIELFPLPCPSTKSKDWPKLYRRWSEQYPDLSFLRSRKVYEHQVLTSRIEGIKRLLHTRGHNITGGQPNIVLFYGKAHIDTWKEIAGGQLNRTWGHKAKYDRRENIVFIATNHVSARGSLTNKECYKLGKKMKREFMQPV